MGPKQSAEETLYAAPDWGECQECLGGVTQLTLRYLGPNVAHIEVYEGKKPKPVKLLFEGTIGPAETFSFNGIRPDGKMGKEIGIFVDDVLNTKIHTSCSKPIGPGLVRGDFEVVRGYSRDGGLLCPLPECQECEGGVTRLTLRYLGQNSAYVQVYEGKDPKLERLLFEGTVGPNETFNFTGIRSDGKMGKEIGIFVDGARNTKIHTSCSKPIGPGLVSGDFEVVSGYSKYGMELCPVPESGWCELGKPRVLTVQYSGQGCEFSNHNQDPGKVECSGDPAFTSPVTILVTDKRDPDDPKAKIWFDGQVDLDATFDIDAGNAGEGKLKTDTFVHIFDLQGNLLQFVRFHTSCSQPLEEGNQFGSLVLVGFTPE